MNYRRIYKQLINRAIERGQVDGYKETHHIIPRCMGGTDDDDNLVDLTAREHFIAHKLLYYIHEGNRSIAYAFWAMCTMTDGNRNYKITNREYSEIKETVYKNRSLGLEEFIRLSREVHGLKYGYSKVNYVNAHTKVTIICPIHGEFEQTPNSHLSGHGCSKCAGITKSNTEEFIEKANEVHGGKYGYSKVVYRNSYTKVIIICPIHGEFEQTPSSHLSGQGCSKCAGNASCNTEEFIEKANEVHGGKYDYSKVVYRNSYTKVIIICPIHGEFEQLPSSHLSSRGCPKCAGITKSNTEEFIKKANEVHGGKYGYSKVNYVNNRTKVTIICPIHGEFEQVPSSHLNGHGCPKCGETKSNTEEFIEKANEVHGGKYGYSKVNYVNVKTKVTIICQKHGEFEQLPNNHLRGAGCPKCAGTAKSNTEEFIEKANEIHGLKYDYSKINYVNSRTKVTIICQKHGEFEQLPSNHLSGRGCPKCGKNKVTNKK